MLVLEDLHWADPDTLDRADLPGDAAESTPLVLVATTRDEDWTAAPLLELVAACQATVLSLGRLGPTTSARWWSRAWSGPPPDEVVRVRVEQRGRVAVAGRGAAHRAGRVGALAPDGRLIGPLTPGVPRTFAATVRAGSPTWSRLPGRWCRPPRCSAAGSTGAAAGDDRAVPGGGAGRPAVRGADRAGRGGHRGDDVPVPARADRGRDRDDLLPPERRALAHAAAEVVERREPEAYDAGGRAADGGRRGGAGGRAVPVAPAGRRPPRRAALRGPAADPGRELAGDRPGCAGRRSGR